MNDIHRAGILMILLLLLRQTLRHGPVELPITHLELTRRDQDLSLKLSCVPPIQPPKADWRLYIEILRMILKYTS